MKELILLVVGFVAGVTALAILVIIADNREWVRNLKRKHGLFGYTETEEERTQRLIKHHKDFWTENRPKFIPPPPQK